MPRKVNFDLITAVEPGERRRVPAGAYECVVTDVKEVGASTDNPRVDFFIDIADGEQAGALKDAWDSEKRVTLWESRPEEIKQQLGLFQNASPFNRGFDPFAAWNADNDAGLSMFVGKHVGVIIREEETFSGERAKKQERIGVVTTSNRPWKFVDVDAVKSGAVQAPPVRRLSSEKAVEAENLRRKYGNGEFKAGAQPAAQQPAQQSAVPPAAPVRDSDIPF